MMTHKHGNDGRTISTPKRPTVSWACQALLTACEKSKIIVDHFGNDDLLWLSERSTKSKGLGGQMIMRMLGLPNNSDDRDVDDGDIKSVATDENGIPQEDMSLKSSWDSVSYDLIHDEINFLESRLFHKIQRMVFVGIYRKDPSRPETWSITFVHKIDLKAPVYEPVLLELALGYENARREAWENIDAGEFHSTTGGARYALQLRPHDGVKRRYRSMALYDDEVISSKTYGWMLPRTWLREVVRYARAVEDGNAPVAFPSRSMIHPEARKGRGHFVMTKRYVHQCRPEGWRFEASYVGTDKSGRPVWECCGCQERTTRPAKRNRYESLGTTLAYVAP